MEWCTNILYDLYVLRFELKNGDGHREREIQMRCVLAQVLEETNVRPSLFETSKLLYLLVIKMQRIVLLDEILK